MASLSADERETVVNMDDGSPWAYVTTWQSSVITKLSKIPSAQLVESLTFGTTRGAVFKLPAKLVSFRRERQSRPLDSRQRQAAGARMAHARKARAHA